MLLLLCTLPCCVVLQPLWFHLVKGFVKCKVNIYRVEGLLLVGIYFLSPCRDKSVSFVATVVDGVKSEILLISWGRRTCTIYGPFLLLQSVSKSPVHSACGLCFGDYLTWIQGLSYRLLLLHHRLLLFHCFFALRECVGLWPAWVYPCWMDVAPHRLLRWNPTFSNWLIHWRNPLFNLVLRLGSQLRWSSLRPFNDGMVNNLREQLLSIVHPTSFAYLLLFYNFWWFFEIKIQLNWLIAERKFAPLGRLSLTISAFFLLITQVCHVSFFTLLRFLAACICQSALKFRSIVGSIGCCRVVAHYAAVTSNTLELFLICRVYLDEKFNIRVIFLLQIRVVTRCRTLLSCLVQISEVIIHLFNHHRVHCFFIAQLLLAQFLLTRLHAIQLHSGSLRSLLVTPRAMVLRFSEVATPYILLACLNWNVVSVCLPDFIFVRTAISGWSLNIYSLPPRREIFSDWSVYVASDIFDQRKINLRYHH